MKEVKPSTEFVIGIDFGHGETSAAYYDLRNQDKLDLDILPGQKVIKSAVAILEQEGKETICVGDAAINNAPVAKDFQISFKKRPSKMSDIERQRMVNFMRGVYAGILDRHPDFKSREHVVYIARPSQDDLWKAEESAYIKIAEDAGLPVAGIQKESRAAFFRARTQGNSKIDQEVKYGVLIVDFGSSTIDFTYLNSKLEKPIDDGCPLGASEVERTLLEYALAHAADSSMPIFREKYASSKDSNPYNQLLFAFREAKEKFYSNPNNPIFTLTFDYGLLTSSEREPIYGFGGISIPRNEINTILGDGIEGGYIDRVRKAVKVFKEEKLKGQKVSCVYLTGGASRMDFVREIFMDIFGLDDAHCPSDDNPSLIVSQGVAHLSYADIKTREKETELRKRAKRIVEGFDWIGCFRSIIGESTKSKIISAANGIMISYKNGHVGEYLTLEDDWNIIDANHKELILREGIKDGYCFVRNRRSLNKRIREEFATFSNCDFAKDCENEITNKVINSVTEELEREFSAFQYQSLSTSLHLSGLSAKITSSGINQLANKFIGEGSGHIIYDAVASCYPFGIMVGLNLCKDRWDKNRLQEYNYYKENYANIFSSDIWKTFLNDNITIKGIESAKIQTAAFVNQLIDEYISYAKLAQFLK